MILKRVFGLRSFSRKTIFSKSSGSGKCGIAVIRVSGEHTKTALKALTGCDNFTPRFATLKSIRDPMTSSLIDHGLILFFESPKSFTGEDSCEFQVHGGPAVVAALLKALSSVEGLRPAQPGEFTRRAFFNGKMDLSEVEGLADLIHAETEHQRRQALIQADGHLSKLYLKWRKRLVRNIAHVEAFIDFSEDENIEDDVLEKMHKDLIELEEEIKQHLVDGRMGERLREGVKMVILGDTNVGKSSLMNILVQRDVSIVTSIEGTTRDVIESHFDMNGYPVVIQDTAGLRHSEDVVESEGISRARKCATNADLTLLLIDGQKMEQHFVGCKEMNLTEYQQIYLDQLGLPNELRLDHKKSLVVINKVDLMSQQGRNELEVKGLLGISCTQSINISRVITELTNHLRELCGEPSAESPVVSHARHRHFLQKCLRHIQQFLEAFDPTQEQDFAILVQNLRSAVRDIGRITGEVRTDDVLDVIFKDFCIGK